MIGAGEVTQRWATKHKKERKGQGYQTDVCFPSDSLEKYTIAPKVLYGLCS